jgi:hypothetical protein
MNKKRIARRERWTSQPRVTKSISIKSAERRSDDDARKAVELTSGELRWAVPESGLRKSGDDLIAAQKSAEGIVGHEPEGPNGWKASRT